MKSLLMLCLVACGVSTPPAPTCALPAGVGTEYPISATFDGSRGLVLHSAIAALGGSATVRLRNAAGNDSLNATELYAFLASCEDGRYLGSVKFWDVPADVEPRAWQQLDAPLSPLKGSGQIMLLVRPLYARGQHLVDIDGFEVTQ